MQRLSPREEDIMKALWHLEKAYVKEIQEKLSEDLHYNTVSTMVRKLESKGFIGHESFGNTHRYFPKISKKEYRKFFMKSVSQFLFEDSYKSMVSFFVKEEKISASELQEILDLIEKDKK